MAKTRKALYPRGKGGTLYFDETIDGRRFVRSTGTTDPRLAKEYRVKYLERAYRTIKLGEKQSRTWGEAVLSWLRMNGSEEKRRSIATIRQRLRWLTFDGRMRDIKLEDISRGSVIMLMDQKRDEDDLTNATLNRYIAEISKILSYAAELEWIAQAPKLYRFEETARDPHILNRTQAVELGSLLPNWMQPIFWFSLSTGLRESNVRTLQWDRINLENRVCWIAASLAKGKKTFGIPLNDEAIAIIKAQAGNCPRYVFGSLGRVPDRCSNQAWYDALIKVGLRTVHRDGSTTGFRWHDLRHTWATWHAESGTPKAALQELGGWATPRMVDKYSHVAQAFVALYACNSLVRPK